MRVNIEVKDDKIVRFLRIKSFGEQVAVFDKT